MTCTQCHRPENAALRKTWGCDGPTGKLVAVFCWLCEGKDVECEHCHGTARIPMPRCPNTVLTSEHWDAVRAASMLEVGILPTAAGWLEHPVTMMQAVSLVTRERARLEEQKRG